ncbi:MAG: SpaH/EbpB family LPXTG-anchored major pilin [Lachnospiraceae bacterium]|nr:SpaH/EbpB family LPXTG-anchored major pilin [Lachnospiraceae bacterium]
MKKLKTLFSVILAFALMVVIALPVRAAETTHTLTIEGTKTGHIYEAYQIFSGTLSTEGATAGVLSNIDWGSGVDGTDLLEALQAETGFGEGANNLFSACNNAEDVAKVLAGWADDSANLDLFAECVGDNLTATCTTSTGGTTLENGIAKYTLSGLQSGYYLIKDQHDSVNTTEHDYYTKFIVRVVRDGQTAKPKGDVPTVEKGVNTSLSTTFGEHVDVNVGDTVYYKLDGSLPSNYGAYENYQYVFEDILSKGLTYVKIEQVYILHQSGNSTDITRDLGTKFTALHENVIVDEENKGKLTITFADLKTAYPSLLASDHIVVKYSATLNGNAVIGGEGNDNTVVLKYTNDPNYGGFGGTTPEDEAKVYSFKLDLYKVDGSDTSKKLGGAEFYLYRNMVDESGATVKQYAIVIDGKLTGWTENKIAATKLVSSSAEGDTKGLISVSGLDQGTYWLVEEKAPEGYNKIDTDVQVTITAGYTGSVLTSLSCKVDSIDGTGDVSNGTVTLQVRNNAGSTLPSTGGIGTTVFYVLGSILVLGAVILLVTKRRMQNEN